MHSLAMQLHRVRVKVTWSAQGPRDVLEAVLKSSVSRLVNAAKIRHLRDDGQSYSEIADGLSRSNSDIARACQTLGCASAMQAQGTILLISKN